MKSVILVSIWALSGVLLLAGPAFAYLDPGTGSMILQTVIAGLAAVGVYAGLFWGRFKGFFGKGKNSEEESRADEN